MKKIAIDFGVQEFVINGGEENGGGVLRFNPSDPNVYNRFFGAMDNLEAMSDELSAKAAELQPEQPANEASAAMFSLIAQYDERVKRLLSDVFGAPNDFDRVLQGVSLMAVAGNGKRVVENLMAALMPIIEQGAQAGAADKADRAVAAAAQNRAARRAAKR